jgi:outer membrane protein assembly factor BamB
LTRRYDLLEKIKNKMMTICAGVIMFLVCTHAVYADWPQWRGPDTSGISSEKGWKTDWLKGEPKRLWQVTVGNGNSCPVVARGKVYTWGMIYPSQKKDSGTSGTQPQSRKKRRSGPGNLTLLCLDAETGRQIWEYSYRGRRASSFGDTSSTPAVRDGRVYVYSHDARLICVDADSGRLIWDKKPEAGGPRYGYAASPLVYEKLVIVPLRKKTESGLRIIAFAAGDGRQVWQSEEFKSDKTFAGWSSPVMGSPYGRLCVIYATGMSVAGVNPVNGETMWVYDFPDQDKYPIAIKGNAVAATPSIDKDRIFIPYYQQHQPGFSLCLSFPGQKPVFTWATDRFMSWIHSCVIWKGHVYGIGQAARPSAGSRGAKAGFGNLHCLDIKDGTLKWSTKMFKKKNSSNGIQTYNGTFMIADSKMIFWAKTGDLVIAEVSAKGFKVLSSTHVLDPVGIRYVTPVLAEGRIYCRHEKGTMVCLDVRGD